MRKKFRFVWPVRIRAVVHEPNLLTRMLVSILALLPVIGAQRGTHVLCSLVGECGRQTEANSDVTSSRCCRCHCHDSATSRSTKSQCDGQQADPESSNLPEPCNCPPDCWCHQLPQPAITAGDPVGVGRLERIVHWYELVTPDSGYSHEGAVGLVPVEYGALAASDPSVCVTLCRWTT